MRIDDELRFEIISTCCAALGGGLLSAVVSWFSPWKAWTPEAAVSIGILFGLTAVMFHLLVRGLVKMAVERQKERDADLDKAKSQADSPAQAGQSK